MRAIFWRIIKDRRNVTLIYIIAAVALVWLYVAIYPSIQAQSASLEQVLKTYPESFLKAFNVDLKSYTTIGGYLAAEQYSFTWPIITIFMLVGFSGTALAGEIEKGTIELLLSQPVSRVKLFLGRYFAGLAILIAYILLSIFAAAPILSAYHIGYDFNIFVTMAVLGFMFSWAIFSLAMFFSSLSSDRGRVYFFSGGLLVLMYILNIVGALKESLSDFKFFSFFYYFNPSKALIYNEIDHWSYLIFIGVAVVATISGAIIFSKRDIAV